MNALDRIRQKAASGIVALLWINVALVVLRNVLRADGIEPGAIAAAVAIGILATVVWLSDRAGATTRIVTSMAHAASVAVLVFSFSGSPLQIDMHLYFFASLAICAVWVDWRAILGYAALVSVHHIVMFFLSSVAVFPDGSDFSRVVLHAAILIVETGVLLALIRSLISALVSAEAAMDAAKAAQSANEEMVLQAKALDLKIEADRRQVNADAEAAAQQRLRNATEGLAKGLRLLAAGDLTFRIDTPFSPEFEALRHDLNGAVTQLADAMKTVAETTVAIDTGSTEISRSVGDLSKRTEQQAASLEETAAALDQITANVASSSKRAQDAQAVAAQANTSALESGKVVADAVDAMQKIEQSSHQVSNIIGVIDQIAFQTNLLALNAGVEAARAGDAGKGFAVVAQEVRDLAQRSAQAAREIKELIRSSSIEVQSGVKLVNETGDALKTIEAYIVTVNDHMDAIATSSREQSTGLAEVNTAVNRMDQVTQQNAAMVEETSAAGATLASESEKLRGLIARFELGGPSASAQPVALRRAASSLAATARATKDIPARRTARAPMTGNLALKDNWEEF